MLIGLAGKAGSGKDEVAKVLVSEFGFTRVAFADAIKRMAEDINPYIESVGVNLLELLEWEDDDWDQAKKYPLVRSFLQRLGVAVRNQDPEFWLRAAGVTEGNVIVTDTRFLNEVDYILEHGGTMLRVVRPGTAVGTHISETDLDVLLLDELHNSGTLEELAEKVRAYAATLI